MGKYSGEPVFNDTELLLGTIKLQEEIIENLTKDKQRLDYLDTLTGQYTGRVILRESYSGRGWRLHETHSNTPNFSTVRPAIDHYRNKNAKSD